MNVPYFSVGAAILYFGWLWQGRSAAERSKDGSLNRPVKEPKRSAEIHALQPPAVESVTAKPFNLEDVSAPVAQGAAQ